MELAFNSDRQTIGNSLMATLAEIEIHGETPILKAEMLFKFARMKFIEIGERIFNLSLVWRIMYGQDKGDLGWTIWITFSENREEHVYFETKEEYEGVLERIKILLEY